MNKKLLIFVISTVLLNSCNENVLKSFAEEENLQEQANLDMQNGNYNEAQKKLESIILNDPNNYAAISMLSACYAAEAGIVLYLILLNASSNTSLPNPSSQPIQFAESILPTPSGLILNYMDLSTKTIMSIPNSNKTSDMIYQQEVFLNIYLLLQMIDALNTLRSGGALSSAQVALIYSSLANISNSGFIDNNNQFLQALFSISAAISMTPGNTQSQQLTNYLTAFI